MIERQVQHMARLVDDLLDVSRITRGKIELRKEPVEAGRRRRPRRRDGPAADRRARHELNCSTCRRSRCWLEGDPARLEQVVANLLNNAAKYTEPGGRIRLNARTRGTTRSVLRVRDTGIGIAPEMLPHSLRPVHPGRPLAVRSQGGLGIGLTLVRRLVEMHGGTVEAHSEGSAAAASSWCSLPALAEAARPPESEARGERRRRRRRRAASWWWTTTSTRRTAWPSCCASGATKSRRYIVVRKPWRPPPLSVRRWPPRHRYARYDGIRTRPPIARVARIQRDGIRGPDGLRPGRRSPSLRRGWLSSAFGQAG